MWLGASVFADCAGALADGTSFSAASGHALLWVGASPFLPFVLLAAAVWLVRNAGAVPKPPRTPQVTPTKPKARGGTDLV